MRQVFAVDGGRSCRVECRNLDRKRGRDGDSLRNGGYSTMQWEDDEDYMGWDEEDEAEFLSFQKSLGNRSVSWSGGGLKIRARNFGSREDFEDGYGYERQNRPALGSDRRHDPCYLWDSEEDSPRFLDGFEEDYGRDRGRGEENYRYDDLNRRRLSPSRSLGRIAPRRDSPEPGEVFPPEEECLKPRKRQHDYYDAGRRDHRSSRRDEERQAVRYRPRDEEADLPPGFERRPESKHRSPSPRREDEPERRTCFNCGKVGHLSAQCAEKDEHSPKRLRTSEDHDRKKSRGKQCYNCGEEGHKSIACPKKLSVSITSKDDGGGREEKRCYNCRETGHLVFECSMLSVADGSRNEKARRSREDTCAMYKTKLTDGEKNQYLRQNKCFTCGQFGHPYYSCPRSENRLEFVFEDREHKAALKLLRSACWNYWDDSGEVHGPVSLSSMTTWLGEGVMHKKMLVRHMHEKIKPITLETLLGYKDSKVILSLLGCMPESASFLGEDMDAESCKEKSLLALQNKLHYDIYETTVRWLYISSMNEALSVYKTARKYWGKQASQIAEDYSDRNGPPHSSDGDLSSPDGVKEMEGQSLKSATLVECCEKYVTDSTLEDPVSKSLAAIQACIHSGVIEAARGGILDTVVGEHLRAWDIRQKEQASRREPVIDVIETTSAMEDLKYEKSCMKERNKEEGNISDLENSLSLRKQRDRILENGPATETSLLSWRITRLKAGAEKAAESAAAMVAWTKEAEEAEESIDVPGSPVVEIISEEESSPTVEAKGASIFKRLKRDCAGKLEQVSIPSPPPADEPVPEEKKEDVPEKRGAPLKIVIKNAGRFVPSKEPREDSNMRLADSIKANDIRNFSLKAKDVSKPDHDEIRSDKKKKAEHLKNSSFKLIRKINIPAPAPVIAKKKQVAQLDEKKKPPQIPASAPVFAKKKEVSQDEEKRKALAPVPVTAKKEDVSQPEAAPQLKEKQKACQPEEKKAPDSEPPQLVLKVFRKTKKPVEASTVTGIPLESVVPGKKRMLKLTQLADAIASECVIEHTVDSIGFSEQEITESTSSEEHTVDSSGSSEQEVTESTSSKEEEADTISQESREVEPMKGCARSSADWKLWKAKERRAVVTVTSARASRAQARKLGGATNKAKARKKMLKFERSRIHAWGVVALEAIEAEDFVVEYVGEVLRPQVADLREVRYQRLGLGGSYLFRVSDGAVIDATRHGGVARFINHSCEPNCYTKVITMEGQKRVFIYARTHITPGTELTYDYKFPREDQKIPCLCGALRCRGFLN